MNRMRCGKAWYIVGDKRVPKVFIKVNINFPRNSIRQLELSESDESRNARSIMLANPLYKLHSTRLFVGFAPKDARLSRAFWSWSG